MPNTWALLGSARLDREDEIDGYCVIFLWEALHRLDTVAVYGPTLKDYKLFRVGWSEYITSCCFNAADDDSPCFITLRQEPWPAYFYNTRCCSPSLMEEQIVRRSARVVSLYLQSDAYKHEVYQKDRAELEEWVQSQLKCNESLIYGDGKT